MTHEEAWDLIPWLVNDSIDPLQRTRLAQHVDGCAHCQGELRSQRVLLQAMNAGPQVEAMPRASLQKLWARLDADAMPPPVPAGPTWRQRLGSLSWMVAGTACLVLLLGASVLALLRPGDPPAAAYRTVTDPAATPAHAGIRAVFAGDLRMSELQALLESTGLHIVAGPSASGVYTLDAAADGDAGAALAALRAHPAVRFAEPAGP